MRWFGVALAALVALGCSDAQAGPRARAFYFIGDEQTGQWCAFRSERLALAAGERLKEKAIARDASISDVLSGRAEVDRAGAISELTLGYGPDSGDWAVTDAYRLDGARAVSLRRGIGYADGSAYHTETYERFGDRLVLRTRSKGTRYTDMRALADLSGEPYFPLVLQAARRRDIPANGVCTNSSAPRP